MPALLPALHSRTSAQDSPVTESRPDRRVRRRERRVVFLVCIVLLLSMADLAVTLILLQSMGMPEANPVAAFVMQARNPVYLILFKTGSVLLSISAILAIRQRWQGELAAWIAASIMLMLTWHWNVYANHMAKFDGTIALIEAQKSEDWQMWWRPDSR